MTSLTGTEPLNTACKTLFAAQLLILEHSLNTLPDKPEETAFSSLCTLWHFALGNPLSCKTAIEITLVDLPAENFETLRTLIDKRINGNPLAYIVGRQNFMGLELISGSSALIPRKETEQLAKVCLGYIDLMLHTQSKVKIIDHFTGSGNLPLCFASRLPQASVYGADISEEAIELARENAKKLNLSVQFDVGDMFEPYDSDSFYGSFDLVSGAPPYIIEKNVAIMASEISDHEPKLAFEAGPFGFVFFMRLIKESPKFIRKGGWLVFEVGLGQGQGISKRLEKNTAFDKVETFGDKTGSIRVVAARKA